MFGNKFKQKRNKNCVCENLKVFIIFSISKHLIKTKLFTK